MRSKDVLFCTLVVLGMLLGGTAVLGLTCSDSDGGDWKYNPGVVKLNSTGNTTNATFYKDTCNGNYLTERVCMNGELWDVYHYCNPFVEPCRTTSIFAFGRKFTSVGFCSSPRLSK